MSDAAKKNLDAVHGVNRSFDTKDFSKLGDYIAEDAVDHAGEQGDIKGLANMKAEFEKMIAGQENAKTEVIKELADDEYAMVVAALYGYFEKQIKWERKPAINMI